MSATEKTLEHVHHELKFRMCEAVRMEYLTPNNIRTHMTSERDHNPDWIKAVGYWHLGEADFYDGHEH